MNRRTLFLICEAFNIWVSWTKPNLSMSLINFQTINILLLALLIILKQQISLISKYIYFINTSIFASSVHILEILWDIHTPYRLPMKLLFILLLIIIFIHFYALSWWNIPQSQCVIRTYWVTCSSIVTHLHLSHYVGVTTF
jgi:hypothetical protein